MKNNKKPMPPREKKATRALNPFDIKQNAKIKYKVLGKKVKGQNRNVAAARAQAESKRRKVLSSQFSNRHKSNEFKDKRLGEQDPTMSLEDKMMARFQTERKRKLRNAQLYALGDSDQEDKGDNDLFLTHKGAKIDDFDLLNNDIRTEEDEDDKNVPLDKEIVEKLHFGGGEPSDVKKSHKEIMHEVMMKSKMFKAERQKTKMAQEDATEALDNDFSDILGLLSFRPRKGEPGYGDDKPALDEFDKLTRELAFEAKEQATERRMTPEEVAKREHDKLAELECKRVARMKGAEEYETKDRKSIGKKKPQMVIMPQTDDDLEADYEVDSRYADGLDDDGSEGTISNEDEKVEGKLVDENDEDFIEGDGSDEEEHDSDDEDLEEKELDKEEVEEIPFVLPCPSSTDELQQLFQIYAKVAEDRSTIVQRIITYYSPRLSVDNQQKMKAFMAVLVRLFLKLASNFSKNKLDLDMIAANLFNLSQQMPDTAGVLFREYLITLRKKLISCNGERKFPDLKVLLFLRMIPHIFPASDLRHNVVSPLETLLGNFLANGIMRNSKDAITGISTALLSLHICREKARFSPEVLGFLYRLFRLMSSYSSSNWLSISLSQWKNTHEDSEKVPFLNFSSSDELGTANSGAAVLNSGMELLLMTAHQYHKLPAFYELFSPVYFLLHDISQHIFNGNNENINLKIHEMNDLCSKSLESRNPLRLQTFGPSALPSFVPKFDANYTLRKDKTADRDKAKMKQLKRQVKRARKGAARELRRDAEFLARERDNEIKLREEQKEEKQREIRRWLEEQNATFNQQVKKGGHMLKGGGSGGPSKKRRLPK